MVKALLRQNVRYQGGVQSLEVAHKNHVCHLLEVLKTNTYDSYWPLVWMSPGAEQAWKTYIPLIFSIENVAIFGETLREAIQQLLTQLFH